MNSKFEAAMERALILAREFEGNTCPNPPVGAVLLDPNGQIVAEGAHEKAGTPHAEIQCLRSAQSKGIEVRGKTLVVTLEPCHHHGRTPPCTDAIVQSGVSCVVFGSKDPNTHVQGNGEAYLRTKGIDVVGGVFSAKTDALIEGFRSCVQRDRPWVTVKVARDLRGSLIPPKGQKTFTSPLALKLAHELRRRSDALLTGSGTVLADEPLFTVRHVPDFSNKVRTLFVMDRRRRISKVWITEARIRGLDVVQCDSFEEVLKISKERKLMRLLVEAGPELVGSIASTDFWDDWVEIQVGNPETITWKRNNLSL